MAVKKKKRKLPLLISLAITVFMIVAIIGFVYVASVVVRASFEDINLDSHVMSLSSRIYYENKNTGNFEELSKVYGTENRVWVPLTDMPDHLQKACIAIEDERFYKHHGFDLKRTLGATLIYIFDKDSGYGGSTITQQLIKNMTGQSDRSVDRKIKEIWNAIRMERKYSKEQILEYYLNTVYFSQGCNGVGAAANTYFSKEVSELSVAESAAIVGITQYPTKFDPFINPENNREKQLLVLDKMRELKYLDKEGYEAAVNETMNFSTENIKQGESIDSYFVEQIVEDVANDLVKYKGYQYDEAISIINSGGFKIYSTIDVDIQRIIDKVYSNTANFPSGLQSAIFLMDPHTGEVKGMCGGVGKKDGNLVLNRAVSTTRPAGSSIKPIAVYGPAVENGMMLPSTIVTDEKIKVESDNWEPKNSYSGFKGSMSLTEAIRCSSNTVSIKTLDFLGVDTSYKFLTEKLGITTLVDSRAANGMVYSDKNLAALALGGLTDGLKLSELTAAYAPFANGGDYIPPHTYTKVIDNNGRIVLDNSDISTKAISEQTAKIMTSMLSAVTKPGGTGSGAALNNMATAGKTGTTDDNYDKWFIGYTPYYLAGVWYGYDIPKAIPNAGNNPAVIVWKKVMSEVHSGLAHRSFDEIPEEVEVAICAESKQLYTPYCGASNKILKTFSYHSAPRTSCPAKKHNKTPCYTTYGAPVIENPDTTVQPGTENPEGGSLFPTAPVPPDASAPVVPQNTAPVVETPPSSTLPQTPVTQPPSITVQ